MTMEDVNPNLNENITEEKDEKKARNKKNTFTLIYIITGLVAIVILGVLLLSLAMVK